MHKQKLEEKSVAELRQMKEQRQLCLSSLDEARFNGARHQELKRNLVRSIAQIESILEKIGKEYEKNNSSNNDNG